MMGTTRLWRRIISFVSVLAETARTLAALAGILTFLGLSSIVLGYIK
jgi:hypothetical protein